MVGFVGRKREDSVSGSEYAYFEIKVCMHTYKITLLNDV